MPSLQSRKRRAEPEDEDESIEGSPEPQTQRRRTQHASDDEDFGRDGGLTQSESIDEMGKKLVRLALACEFQRRPIRRSDISEKVLGTNSRQFKQVWAKAQMDLEAVFGMQMVEMPAKEKLTMQQKRAAQKATAQVKTATTSWQVISILPPEFRDPQIIQPMAAPTVTDESAYTAIYTILVAMIRLSGGTLPDVKMERVIKKLGLEDRTPVPGYEETPKLMKRLEKEDYIRKIKESTGTGEDDVYWVVSSRGKVEVSDDAVRGLVERMYSDMKDPEADQDLERKIARSLGIADRAQNEAADAQQQADRSKKKAPKKKRNTEEESEEEADDDGVEEDDDDDEEDE